MKNRFRTVIMLAILGLSHVAIAQDFEWAKRMGGTVNEKRNSIAIDALGNLYTTGELVEQWTLTLI